MAKKMITYGHKVPTGKSIRETIWDELDDVMDLMMESGPPEQDPWWLERKPDFENMAEHAKRWQKFGKWQGIAEGVCFVIALFENPEHPDIDSVKGTAVLRWEERQKEQIPEDRTFDDEVETPGPEPGDSLDSMETSSDPEPRAGQAPKAE